MQVTKLVYCIIPTMLCDFYIFANKRDCEKIMAFKIVFCLLFYTYKFKKKDGQLCADLSLWLWVIRIFYYSAIFLRPDKTHGKSEKCPVAKRSSKGGGSEAGVISVGTVSSSKGGH